ncbi:Hypothetical protein, putative [Bodo saltans]|uniref:Uncharacterized protein n=1 Tax=Bodo saltans TaxID=75058 RepID=A0A0S4J8C8_BODSA|nr:Hypothetical protein, putative [Bodo saltans]|eukprot:CUG86349.1 Hypothetical protein, putative [Bodo saltans]
MILRSFQNTFGGSHNPLLPRTTMTSSSSSPSSALPRKQASTSTALHTIRGTASSSCGDASSSFVRTTAVGEFNNSESESCALAPNRLTAPTDMTKIPSFSDGCGRRPSLDLTHDVVDVCAQQRKQQQQYAQEGKPIQSPPPITPPPEEHHRCCPPPPHNTMRCHSGAKRRSSSTCHPTVVPAISPRVHVRLSSVYFILHICRNASATRRLVAPQVHGQRVPFCATTAIFGRTRSSASLPP